MVPSADVDLNSKSFQQLVKERKKWVFKDHFCNPGPIQFSDFGKFSLNMTLRLEHENYSLLFKDIEDLCEKLKSKCRFGSHEDTLKGAYSGLKSLNEILELMEDK